MAPAADSVIRSGVGITRVLCGCDALTQGGHDHPIARTPAHPLDLPLENLDLAPQSQHFGLQLGLVTTAGHQYVQQHAQR